MIRFSRPVSLSTLLPATLVTLVVAAVVPVVMVAYLFAGDTAARLLAREREAVLDRIEAQLRQVLDPVAAQVDNVAALVADGGLRLDEEGRVDSLARGLLAGSTRARGVGVIRPDGTMRRWDREAPGPIEADADELVLGERVLAATRAGASGWTAPFYSRIYEDVTLAYPAPLVEDGTYRGALTVAVTAQDLAGYAEELSREGDLTAFVLAGRDRVLFYPGRAGSRGVTSTFDLPSLAESSDPVVRSFSNDPQPVSTRHDMRRSRGHWARVDGEPYTYIYREVNGYGPRPLTVVIASRSQLSRWDRWSPTVAAALGLVLMSMAAFAAWVLGRRFARPVGEIDRALAALADMRYRDVDVDALTRSPVAEWSGAARRVRQTTAALSRLTRYVPRALTERLVRLPDPHTEPSSREITVLMLDLQGFTPFAARSTPRAAADALAAVFERAGPLIEAEDGVIDKYTGDGLLAFWGAPGDQPDHAERALRAVTRIRETWSVDPPAAPRARIGLHSGTSLVGDVGFEGRVDFTLIGRVANTVERTQAALRTVDPGGPLVIGGSAAFLAAIGEAAPHWLHRVGNSAAVAA